MSPKNFKTAFSRTIRRIIGYSVIALCFIVVSGLFLVEERKEVNLPVTQPASLQAPQTPSAKAWGVFDLETGRVQRGVDTDSSYPIASVTKLFVAEAVLRSSRKNETFTISYSDLATEGRAGKLVYGEKVTPYSLLFPLLLESSNDAGEAIRRFLGEEYDTSIHDLETSLSLHSTNIADGSGLSVKNTSSVHDLALMYSYLKETHPHILDITQLHTYIGENTGYVSNNPGGDFSNFQGGKHGFTPEAGKTFVGSFTVPDSNREVGIVLLGSNDLLHDIEKLLASDIMAQ